MCSIVCIHKEKEITGPCLCDTFIDVNTFSATPFFVVASCVPPIFFKDFTASFIDIVTGVGYEDVLGET